MKKLYFLFILSLINIAAGIAQDYILDYDVQFWLQENKRRYYIHNAYYYTFNSSSKKTLPDFEFSRRESNHRVTGSLRIPASGGFIKEIIFNTARQKEKCALACWWESSCNQDALIFRASSNNTTCFNLKNNNIDWKCLNHGATIYKFECYPDLSITRPPKNTIIRDEKLVLNATSGFPSSVYKWRWSSSPPTSPTSGSLIPSSCFTDGKFDATGLELLGSSFGSMIGKVIYVWIDLGCDKRTDAIDIDVKMSAPKLVSAPDGSTECPGENTGKITVVIDRPLIAGEEIIELVAYSASNGIEGAVRNYKKINDTTYEITGLFAADDYVVEVGSKYNGFSTDMNDADHKKTGVKVIDPDPVSYSVNDSDKKHISCKDGDDGSFKVTAGGGKAPYTLWVEVDGSSTFSQIPGNQLQVTGLKAGTHRYYITDSNNCELEDPDYGGTLYKSVVLTEPEDYLEIAIISGKTEEPTGNGRDDGYITIGITGGTAPYTVVWKEKTSGTTLSTVDNSIAGESKLHTIPAGTYTVTVTDSKGCILPTPGEYTIDEPNALKVTVTQQGQVLCYGDETASLTASASGGIGEPYTYVWSKKNEYGVYVQVSTGALLSNQGAGDYKVLVSDGSTPPNEKEIEYTISGPAQLTASATKNDVDCKDTNTGSIILTIAGGNTPYNVYYKERGVSAYTRFTTSSTSYSIANLKAENYDYYVTDVNNCSAKIGSGTSGQISITEPDEVLEITSSELKRPSGAGRSDGSITIKVKGGIPYATGDKYTMTWKKEGGAVVVSEISLDENGVFTSKIKDLEKGIYSVQIQDNNTRKCTIRASLSLTDPPPLTITLDETKSVDCFGNNTAQITAHAGGGIPHLSGRPYTYRWYKVEGGADILVENQNDSIYSNIGIGTYKVNIEDGSLPSNTIESSIINITQPPILETSIVETKDVSCFEGSDGAIHISVRGGVGDYKLYYKHDTIHTDYNLYPITMPESTFYIDNLPAGKYSIYIKDANGCYAPILGQDVAEIVLSAPDKPLSIVSQQINTTTGPGRSDGHILLVLDGGTPFDTGEEYQVTWTDGDGNTITPENDLNSEGLFTSKIKDLPKGVYNVEIKDKNYQNLTNGCYFTASINLKDPPPLIVTIENTKTVDCFGDNSGEMVAHVQGGIPYISGLPYKYDWYKIDNDGRESLITGNNDSILSNLPIGFYKIRIADGSLVTNYTESDFFEITQPEELVTNVKTHMISCYQGSDGYIHISVTGGTGNSHKLFYKLIGVDTDYHEVTDYSVNNTFYLNNLPAGIYSVYIQDENMCYASINGKDIAEIELTQPEKALSISSDIVYDPTGHGLSNGEIQIQLEGGTPEYTVIWKDDKGNVLTGQDSVINGAFTSILTGLGGGKYNVEVRDANYNKTDASNNTACILTKEYELIEPEELTLALEETHYVSCNQMSDGEIAAHVKGGVRNKDINQAPYKYTWYRQEAGNFVVMPDRKDSILTNIPAGIYKLEIEDYGRYPNKISATLQVAQPEMLTATTEDVHIVCGEVATISVSVSGGTLPYTYKWNIGDTTSEVKDLNPGKYMVIVTDARGCEVAAIARVITPSDLSVSGKINNPVCYQSTNGSIVTQVTGGTGPYTYKWSTGESTKDIINIGAGIYTIIVTDNEGCSFSESFELKDPELAKVDLGEDRTLCIGQSYLLEPVVEDPKTTFIWTDPNGAQTTDSKIELNRAGAYKLTITDSKGCQATDEMHVFMTDYSISAEMVVATDVFVNDTIVLVNISTPDPEKLEWLFSDDDPIEIVETTPEMAKIIFKQTGDYSVGMRSHIKDCFQDVVKTLNVTESNGSGDDNFGQTDIKEFVAYPNPNDGIFKVKVELGKQSTIRLRIFSLNKGGMMDDRTLSGSKSYDEQYQKSLAPGVYILLLETASGRKSQKVLIR